MAESPPIFFTLEHQPSWTRRLPEPPRPVHAHDPPYQPPPPAWVQARVGSVPFGYVIVGGQEHEKPVRWEHELYGFSHLHIQGQAVSRSGLASATMQALFDSLATEQRPPLPLVKEITDALATGLTRLDRETVTPISDLLPPAYYLASLSTLRPQRVEPGSPQDYLTNEVHTFWRQGSAASSSYYRTPGWREPAVITFPDGHQIQGEDVGVNVLLPTQPLEGLNPKRVRHYGQRMEAGGHPTIVSLQVLEHRDTNSQSGAAVALASLSLSVHHVLDGHHKLQAAALTGLPLTVLAFTALPWVQGHWAKAWIGRQQRDLAKFAHRGVSR